MCHRVRRSSNFCHPCQANVEPSNSNEKLYTNVGESLHRTEVKFESQFLGKSCSPTGIGVQPTAQLYVPTVTYNGNFLESDPKKWWKLRNRFATEVTTGKASESNVELNTKEWRGVPWWVYVHQFRIQTCNKGWWHEHGGTFGHPNLLRFVMSMDV
eukprot:TRINITY_DN67873_c3_g10_i2.p1 TRINITY_DN67873_c3_g10~~TRINITY_DN67873_c3_g10_i2.p1  ORF type:complete len:156 (+),score=0.67 TRINITY_DN67873_c3_g10_i2:539-1006(+)